jgi:hypothetical protein
VRTTLIVTLHGLLVICACGPASGPAPGSAITDSYHGGAYHLGQAGGREPVVNLDVKADGTFAWRTDPALRGDFIPSGEGTWAARDGLVVLLPRTGDTFFFAPVLEAALYPSTYREVRLAAGAADDLVTHSVVDADASTQRIDPASSATWLRGRACSAYGTSSECVP